MMQGRRLRRPPHGKARAMACGSNPRALPDCRILGLAAGAGNAAAKHLARVACQVANSEPKKTPRCS